MRIGITGITGLIGSTLARLVTEDGHSVIGFSRFPSEHASLSRPMRLLSLQAPVDVSGIDVLVHLAGEPPLGLWTKEKRRRIRDSRVETTRHLVDCMIGSDRRPAAFLCASGTDYYGNRGDELLTEESPHGRGFLAGIARDWESEALKACNHGIRVACLRLGLVLDPCTGPYPWMKTLFGMGLGARMGNGDQYLPWIDVADAAALFLHVAQHQDISGPVNAVTPEPWTNRQFSEALARAQGSTLRWMVPSWIVEPVLGELSGILLDSQRVLPKKALDTGFVFRKTKLEQ